MAPPADADGRSMPLTVPLRSGLGNRLWNILCLAAVAEATGQSLEVRWFRTPDLGGRIGDLFEPFPRGALPFAILDEDPMSPAPFPGRPPREVIGAYLSGLLGREVNHWRLLITPGLFPSAAPFVTRCVDRWASFSPSAPLAARIERFSRDHFRPTMIGVHLRRGDFVRVHPRITADEAEAIRLLDAHLAADPDAGVLLVTDDGAIDPMTREARGDGVRERFKARYGERLVTPPCQGVDRATAAAAEDAVVDLWLLRQVDRFVGTAGSTFSAMAMFARGIPASVYGGTAPGCPPSA